MDGLTNILLAIAAWLAVVGAAHWLGRRYLATGPRGDAAIGLLWRLAQIYTRLVHRVRFEGLENLPKSNRPGGMIIVSNHTGAIDPVILQAACRFEIRWLMAEDMMVDELDWLWQKLNIIPVARKGADSTPLREAIRHVRNGGVIGIFPEGGIEDPPGRIRPFHEGVGLVVSRTRAPVQPVWISQTPRTTSMIKSLLIPSHARAVFIEQVSFERERDPARITEHLRRTLADVSGWPLDDTPLATNGNKGVQESIFASNGQASGNRHGPVNTDRFTRDDRRGLTEHHPTSSVCPEHSPSPNA